MKTLVKILIVIVILSAIGGVVWFVLQAQKNGQDPIALVSQLSGQSVTSLGSGLGVNESPETQRFIAVLNSISGIRPLNTKLFTAPVYESLINNSVSIQPDQNPGRANPFADFDGFGFVQ